MDIQYSPIKNINEGLNYIKNSDQNYFFITGSLYLVGKIREKFFIK